MIEISFAISVEILLQILNVKTLQELLKTFTSAHFGVKPEDEDKSWAPHKVCCCCVDSLQRWGKEKQMSMVFGVPMVWREPKSHGNEIRMKTWHFC